MTARAADFEEPSAGGRAHSGGPVAVVGYEGSDVSKAALAFAAHSVGPEGRVIVAFAYAPSESWFGAPSYHPVSVDYRQHAVSILDNLPSEVLGSTRFETRLVAGPPARVLIDLAHESDADQIVVGMRKLGLVRTGLGSVSRTVLDESDLPVTVVPPGYYPESVRV